MYRPFSCICSTILMTVSIHRAYFRKEMSNAGPHDVFQNVHDQTTPEVCDTTAKSMMGPPSDKKSGVVAKLRCFLVMHILENIKYPT